MRRHHLASVSLTIAASLALAATSCGDDTKGAAQFTGGLAGSAGDGTGGVGMSGGSAGMSGNDGTSGSTGGGAEGGVAGSGGASAGAGGKGGAGGTGGASGSAGNGGVGGNPVVRVFTIEGCDLAGVGGAGGADGAGGATEAGGAAGAGGAADLGGAGGDVTSGPGPLPDPFASFTVYNFDTDQPVQTCVGKVDDFSITITGDAPLTVATNIKPGVLPASVVWIYDGVAQGPHNIFPYSLGPDDNGNYQEPTPPLAVGAHVLTITAYDEADGTGNVLGTMTITVTVIDGA